MKPAGKPARSRVASALVEIDSLARVCGLEADTASPESLVALRARLLNWFRREKRDLPWRRTRDPYAIWISEIMLQQTRVETVVPYYERFLGRFPTVAALADAPLDSVLKLWEGLGYYTRARNLHRGAAHIVQSHAARMPQTSHEWRAVPGVGRYTAAAICSIAFGESIAALDGNIQRVLARLFAVRRSIDSASAQRGLWELAETVLDRAAPGEFNEALMELGARVCVPVAPRCATCPLNAHCAALAAGLQHELPVRRAKRGVPVIHAATFALRRRGRFLFVQRRAGGLLGGLWELPSVVTPGSSTDTDELAALLRQAFGIVAASPERLGSVTHKFTHRTLHAQVFGCERASGRLRRGGHAASCWIGLDRVGELALSTLDRRIVEVVRWWAALA